MSDEHEPDPRLREATAGEDKLSRYLSRVVGQILLRAWDQLPPEIKEDTTMTRMFCSALAHNLGQMLASAPREAIPIDDAGWLDFIETTCAMVRTQALEARTQLLTPPQEPGAAPRLQIPEPKLVM
jgi:hypothetical protein